MNALRSMGNPTLEGTVPDEVLQTMLELVSAMQIRHSLETGCGRSTLLFSNLSEDHHVFTLGEKDIKGYVPNLKYILESPVLRKQTVRFTYGSSLETLPQAKFPHSLDLVFIDGAHGYPAPEIDYFHLYRHIAPNGLLIIDDIHIPTLRNFFQFLCAEPMWRLERVTVNTAFFRRTHMPESDPTLGNWPLQPYNQRKVPANPLILPFQGEASGNLVDLAASLRDCERRAADQKLYIWGTGRFGRAIAELFFLIGQPFEGFVSSTPAQVPGSQVFTPVTLPAGRPFFAVASGYAAEIVAEIKKIIPAAREGRDYVVLPFQGRSLHSDTQE